MDSPRQKYRPFETVRLPDRRWPDARIERAPRWCSVDLRDGNQALAIPMNVAEKHELFQTLCRIGFKEIEIGFPSASDTEFAFTRELIEQQLIPEDVSVQVLVQAREHLIRRTIDSLKGAHRAIVHLYTPTNPAQREIVFNLSKAQVLEMAVNGTKLIRELTDALPDTHWQLEFSPETFVLTEPDYALEVCEAVAKAWGASAQRKIILNLPLTVEAGTPNTHADQIEWFCRHLSNRAMAIVSLHTHNDRGTGVAATELGLMAGADRVEGTLFGNGERTGNLDIVTVALNMFSHGIDPHLDFRNLGAIREVYERVTRMSVHDRHPYGGDLVFTAFSGSHQDAIKKGMDRRGKIGPDALWDVPYLTIDPMDIGRSYEAIIRINSQSGKGGVAYVLDREFGFDLPKLMHPEVGNLIGKHADKLSKELTPAEIHDCFRANFVNVSTPLELLEFDSDPAGKGMVACRIKVRVPGAKVLDLRAEGNGPISALVHALEPHGWAGFTVKDYRSHALASGSESSAAAYVCVQDATGRKAWGCGVDANIELAGLKALVSAANRLA
ncbi:MAG: 2-isopropylmalate synthase [Opitutales bacterium]|jgi:2-isopropylmalate synthase|nr:2-isopropylmalate synthase [Opitutales bacterium]MDP4787064.1 2-isopropylmalate synthase [Opitutales bacterium]MDP4860338.1 2-isopropylmalate synthase [Opitutales bacterium]MDP4893816.1 2-isopropylmalate synthase [Opitutales bacterium]MDP5013149.1 2-isopropylmalate synthase [Opitutales bacterium]